MSKLPALTAAEVKRAALDFGADLVGIGSIDRWNNAPVENHPKTIMPRAQSVICIGFRMHRGLHRGVEEGTYFSAYTLTGYTDLNQHIAPVVQRRLASFIEDYGWEATPVMYLSGSLGNDIGEPALNPDGTTKPKPDIFFNFRIAGELCGAGQVGYSRMFLTPKFGPAQRIYFIITDAKLDADPIISDICDGCQECVRQCPANALFSEKRDDVDVPGVTHIERSAIDVLKCSLAHGYGAISPFAPQEVKDYAYNIINGDDKTNADGTPRPTREEIQEAIGDKVLYSKNAKSNFHGPAVLCADGCVRGCLAHLEKTGRLELKFHNPFRD
jgi:ferredoxin